MRILSRAQFLACPAGTVFMRHHAGTLGFETAPAIKTSDDYNGHDFTSIDLRGDIGENGDAHFDTGEAIALFDRANAGERVGLFYCDPCRDGMFDDHPFAVLDTDDLDRLIAALVEARSKLP